MRLIATRSLPDDDDVHGGSCNVDVAVLFQWRYSATFTGECATKNATELEYLRLEKRKTSEPYFPTLLTILQ